MKIIAISGTETVLKNLPDIINRLKKQQDTQKIKEKQMIEP